MKYFKFIMYSYEIEIGKKLIKAKNIDEAIKSFNKLDLPFHTVSTVEIMRNIVNYDAKTLLDTIKGTLYDNQTLNIVGVHN